MKPPALPPCYQPRNVSGACECGARLEPAHYQVAQERLSCGACCNVCSRPSTLSDGPVAALVGVQEGLF
jgi:hypothetical protein